MTSEIAERYGEGLFALAKEENTVSSWKDQVTAILSAMEENDDLHLFFQAVKISKEEKRDFIDKVFKDADKDIRNFMKLVIDKGRSYYMQEIFESYEKRANEELGIQKAVVTSARKLSEEDMQRIKETLAKKTGKTIVLTNKVDPSVIAGIKVTVGNNVTDITMSTRIEQLRNALLKGGQA